MVAHWVACLWFFIGYLSMANNMIVNDNGELVEAISMSGLLSNIQAFDSYPSAHKDAFGDSWLMRHFGPKNIQGKLTGGTVEQTVGWLAQNRTSPFWFEEIQISQLYFTSLYWSFTMLMKSPHIGPDTWIEKCFGCISAPSPNPCLSS